VADGATGVRRLGRWRPVSVPAGFVGAPQGPQPLLVPPSPILDEPDEGAAPATAPARARGGRKGRPPRPPRQPPPPSGPPAAQLDGRAITDVHNATRLAERVGDVVRWDPTVPAWRVWNGRVWAIDRDNLQVCAFATAVLTDLEATASAAAEQDVLRAVRSHQSASHVKAMMELAKGQCGGAGGADGEADPWDADPWLLNCPNGTVDLRTGQLRPHNKADWCTKMTATDFPVGAAGEEATAAPVWTSFLRQIFLDDEPFIAWVQRAAGMSLVGEVVNHVLLVCWGQGGNGKSTMIETLTRLLGDYAMTAPRELLTDRNGSNENNYQLATMRGTRFCSLEEGTARLDVNLVKWLTGGDLRTVRPIYGKPFTYRPSDTFWAVCNEKPAVPPGQNSEGFWRRVKLIPFLARVTLREDPQMKEKLRAEWPQILAWMVAGCRAWHEDGHRLGDVAAVTEATAAYRQEMDVLSAFLSDCTVPEPGAAASVAGLYEEWRRWAEANGEKALTMWLGFRLRDDPPGLLAAPPSAPAAGSRPQRGDYGSDQDYEEAFEAWHRQTE